MKEIRSIGQTILGLLFIIYLIGGYKTPAPLAEIIDTTPGKLILAIVSFSFFLSVHPLLGILGFVVAYEIVRRSIGSKTAAVIYMPSERKKARQMASFNENEGKLAAFNEGNLNENNQFPYTLEQEVVSKMAPMKPTSIITSPPSFTPNPEKTYDAAMVQDTNSGCGM